MNAYHPLRDLNLSDFLALSNGSQPGCLTELVVRLDEELSADKLRQLKLQFGDCLLGEALLRLEDGSMEHLNDPELVDELVTACCISVEALGEPLVSSFARAVGANDLFRRALLGRPECSRPFNSEVFIAMRLLRPHDLIQDTEMNFRAVSRFPSLAIWLLERDMLNIHARDEFDRTLLMEVVRSGRSSWYINRLAKGLLSRGIDVNAVDKAGHNALMYLVQHWWGKTPSLSTVKLLVDAGADAFSVNSSGESIFLIVAQKAARSPPEFQARVHEFLHYRLLSLIQPS